MGQWDFYETEPKPGGPDGLLLCCEELLLITLNFQDLHFNFSADGNIKRFI